MDHSQHVTANHALRMARGLALRASSWINVAVSIEKGETFTVPEAVRAVQRQVDASVADDVTLGKEYQPTGEGPGQPPTKAA